MGAKIWSRREERFLERNFSKMDMAKIMESLGKTLFSIKRKANEMGLERDIYGSGLFYSTGDITELLDMPKATIYNHVRSGALKCTYRESLSKKYKLYSVENIIDFLYEYPQKWKHRNFDIEGLQMLFLDYKGAKYKVEAIKKTTGKPYSYWRQYDVGKARSEYIPTVNEMMEAIQ